MVFAYHDTVIEVISVLSGGGGGMYMYTGGGGWAEMRTGAVNGVLPLCMPL